MYEVAVVSAKSKLAQEQLEMRLSRGELVQAELIRQVAELHIVDRLVAPRAMEFDFRDGPRLVYGQEIEPLRIHTHALGQLCSVAGLPRLFMSRLSAGEEWERDLLSHNFNTLFHKGEYLDRKKQPTKFLHRIVGAENNRELRGFLSRSFNRHLSSMPLLKGFVQACYAAGAKPAEAITSSTRFSLKCMLPFAFEPIPGEFVAFGQTWSNSDFGAGRMRVSMSLMRIISGNHAILEDSLSRVHIGSIIEDSDLELSDATAAKEVDAQVSAIHDIVGQSLQPDAINRLLKAIVMAHEEELPWHRIKTEMGRLLSKGELDNVKQILGGEDIIDLPPLRRTADGDPIYSRWRASGVLGWLADKEPDPDRRSDLQTLAGSMIGVK